MEKDRQVTISVHVGWERGEGESYPIPAVQAQVTLTVAGTRGLESSEQTVAILMREKLARVPF
jgi:hypothetical protein